MLAIGRALMSNPRVLLMDEPSEGLAPQIVAEVMATIRRLKAQGLSIVLVEQNAKLVFDVADDIVILNSGRVVVDAPRSTRPAAASTCASTSGSTDAAAERLSVAGVELDVLRRGAGPPLVLLHGFAPVAPDAPFSTGWPRTPRSSRRRIPASATRRARPTSTRSTTSSTSTCALLEQLPHERVTLLGLSFGGWLAAEIAVACAIASTGSCSSTRSASR